MTVAKEKAAIRAEVLSRRAKISAEHRQGFATRLAEAGLALLALRETPPAAIASAYQPIRHEPDTATLLDVLTKAGFLTALPITLGLESPLRFHLWRPGDSLKPGRWAIPEPLHGAPLVDPDVLFVPLAAFDRQGFRLGYGAGFYDNALARLRAQKPVLAIGVAYGLQEVERVPREPHDQRLDAIITDTETFMTGAG